MKGEKNVVKVLGVGFVPARGQENQKVFTFYFELCWSRAKHAGGE